MASATLFTALKWAGAAYLIWGGVKLWRAGGAFQPQAATATAPQLLMISHAWIVTALNPKSIVFFVAFLPQFLDRSGDVLSQMLIFGATFLVLSFANALGYGFAAARARGLVSNARAMAVVNKVGGGLLIGAGVATVAAGRV